MAAQVHHIALFWFIWLPFAQCKISCVSNSDNDINWWFTYKLPERTPARTPEIICGTNSGLYYEEGVTELRNIRSLYSRDNSALARTVSQIYANKHSENVSWLAYSDQPPATKWFSGKHAHSKGMIVYDHATNGGGFWIVHSQPRWPNFDDKTYKFQPPATFQAKKKMKYTTDPKSMGDTDENAASNLYGQHFICISFNDLNTFNNILGQLRYIRPYVYNGHASTAYEVPENFQQLIKYKGSQNPPPAYQRPETDRINDKFTFLSTTPSSRISALELIQKKYSSKAFIWDTWISCYMKIPPMSIGQYLVTQHKVAGCQLPWGRTHTKIAVSVEANGIVCAGDLNVYHSDRGGGYICFTDKLNDLLKANIYSEIDPFNYVVDTRKEKMYAKLIQLRRKLKSSNQNMNTMSLRSGKRKRGEDSNLRKTIHALESLLYPDRASDINHELNQKISAILQQLQLENKEASSQLIFDPDTGEWHNVNDVDEEQ